MNVTYRTLGAVLGLVAGCLIAAAITTAQQPARKTVRPGWQPDPSVVAELEKRQAPWLYREELVPKYTLPDPLKCSDGSQATTAAVWEAKRRPETLDLFRKHIYGRPPAPMAVSFAVTQTDPKAMDGKATLKRIKITSKDKADKQFGFDAAVLIPNGAPIPAPAFVFINHRAATSADPTRQQKDGLWPAEEIVGRGYAAAVFQVNDVDPDKKGDEARAAGVRGVWPAGGGVPGEDAWATIGAWAWGASRVLDYLRTDPAIDRAKVAVVGHSRGGKTALWAAAQDERFAIGISNESGRGGASLTRRQFGEPVKAILTAFPYWYCGNYMKTVAGNADDLPVDQHQLVALIAPRPVYVASADADLWADPRGEFLSLVHAGPVYGLYSQPAPTAEEMPPLDTPLIRGRFGYHIRRGVHNLTPYDWARFLDFADLMYGR
jgi:(4-O-methyl)-D-glucuronate---lignin esterase